MLHVCTDIKKYKEFRDMFMSTYKDITILDFSKVSSGKLAGESNSLVSHHSNCAVFLGYLEPGWMLDMQFQTQIRKMIRKFPVFMVTMFVESIPFSWKNEIDTLYTYEAPK
jgi:hypothetical protein